VLAHSLGARVALCALPDLMAGDVRRMVLLTGAEFTPAAQRALQSPAGRLLEVLNITSRENDLFDLMFEMTLSPLGRRGRALGTGFDAAQVLTVQIDCPAHRAALHRLGHRIAPPSARICHWSAYLRPGLFPLYRRFLHRPETLPFAALRTNLPRNQAPRWSRLVSPHGAGFGQSTPA